jgi:hypothetical protein
MMSLKRDTPQDQVMYLEALAQGIDEGTIEPTKEQMKVLEIEFKAAGLLNADSTRTNVNVTVKSDELQSLLDWRTSSNTLQGNSTVVDLALEENNG